MTVMAGQSIVPAVAVLMLTACVSAPPGPPPAPREVVPPVESPADRAGAGLVIARTAESALGAPYRYGGVTLQGFDCSGLTQFAYRSAGISIPRTAAAQQHAADLVPPDALLPGDLVFFATGRNAVDHVGVYAGQGRFVHAPASGRVVSIGYLADPWYAAHFAGAGRFRSDDASAQSARASP